MQLAEVVPATRREVRERLGRDAAGHGRSGHQLRVRRVLATQQHERQPRGAQRVDPFWPRPAAPEQPQHDDRGTGEERGQPCELQSRRVRRAVERAGRAGREELGVRGRQQQDGAGSRRLARTLALNRRFARTLALIDVRSHAPHAFLLRRVPRPRAQGSR